MALGTLRLQNVVRSAGIVSVAVAMSRVTGLVREMVMARLFGAGFIYDAFLLGFRIPNLTRDLFAEGALSSAFVPIFTQTLAQKGRKEAAVLSNLVGTALILDRRRSVRPRRHLQSQPWSRCWPRDSARCPANSSWP